MYRIEIQHKYCGATTFIYGESVREAFKKENKDKKFWNIIYIDFID